MNQMTLSRALRYKKRVIESLKKIELDIQQNNSRISQNTPEFDVEVLVKLREKITSVLTNLKLDIQKATFPIMNLILELGEVKGEIVFWSSLNTRHGLYNDYSDDSVEYVATFRKKQIDEKVNVLKDKIDFLQTSIDSFNNETKLYVQTIPTYNDMILGDLLVEN